MHTHFKNLAIRTVFLFFALVAGVSMKAQNSLHVSVLPPYTNRLADYANSPNKVMVIVTINPASTPNFSGKIFFRGKLKNASGDIEIASRPGFRPAMPLTLPAGMPGMPIVYTVPFAEIQNLFVWNNLNYSGISMDDIVRYGMPEDLYTFCIETVDYETLEVLIEETCSPAFNVALLEPPMIINPINERTISTSSIQSVLFNWTLPPGAPLTTRYTLRIVEMKEGVNPNEALRSNNYPLRFFETTVTGNSFLYTETAPKLEPGKTYAFAVAAADPETQSLFRNKGMSEIHTFAMDTPEPEPETPMAKKSITPKPLDFFLPNEENNKAFLNSQTEFWLSWNWKELMEMVKSGQTVTYQTLNDICENMGVERFRLKIEGGDTSPSTPLSFSHDITFNYDSLSYRAHQFIITQEEADVIGFIDGNCYKASVEALNEDDEVISSATSIDFQYGRLPEKDPVAKVYGVVDYSFKDRPGVYHATHTPVTIKAFNPSTGGDSPFAVMTAMTDSEGKFAIDDFLLPDVSVGDSIVFRLKTENQYYLDYAFKETSVQLKGDTTSVNFGQLLAQTHGYSLKLNVEKRFTVTPNTIDNFPAGVEVALYRKTKADYIPPVEGDMDDSAKRKLRIHLTRGKTGNEIVEVARGKTQIEVLANGKKNTFVQFDRLLSAVNTATDEYYIQAINPGQTTNSIQVWSDSAYYAEEMPYFLPLPAQFNPDSIYRNVTATYLVLSKVPPTSNVKGQLTYKWKTDPNGIVRPMTNTNFYIVEDWVVNGKSARAGKFATTEDGILSDGTLGTIQKEIDLSLLPVARIVGSGKTDAEGYFDVSIVNDSENDLYTGTYTAPSIISTDMIRDEKTIPAWMQSFGRMGVDRDMMQQMIRDGHMNPVINPVGLDYSGKFVEQVDRLNIVTQGIQSQMNLDKNISKGAEGVFMVGNTINTNKAGEAVQNAATKNKVAFAPTDANDAGWLLAETGVARGPNPEAAPPYTQIPAEIKTNINMGELIKTTNVELSKINNAAYQSFRIADRLERVFRVIPQPAYYYPNPDDYFGVKPLDTKELEPQLHIVAEQVVKVKTVDENGQALKQLVTSVFRLPTSKKTSDPLPLGEGDNTYNTRKLINPQYKSQTADGNFPTPKNVLFDKEFEHLWDQKLVGNDGMVALSGLLRHFGDYYIEACSENDQGDKHYTATFAHINMPFDYPIDQEIWKGNKNPDTLTVTLKLKPLPSRVFMLVKDETTSNPLPNARIGVAYATVKLPGTIGGQAVYSLFNPVNLPLTDSDGFVEALLSKSPLADLLEKYKQDPGTNFNNKYNLVAQANKAGYSSSEFFSNTFNQVSLMGEQWRATLPMRPGGKLSIEVKESGKSIGVPAYIAINSTIVDTTDASGKHTDLRVPNIAGTQIVVIPKDPAYFNDTIIISDTRDSYFITSNVQRRKHRIHFKVMDNATLNPISFATVSLGDTVRTTRPLTGGCTFEFENVSVNNYTFTVRGPDNEDYAPITLNLVNEESKEPQLYNVYLSKGSRISGEVKLDGKLVPNAKVYLEVSQQTTSTVGSSNGGYYYYINPAMEASTAPSNLNIGGGSPPHLETFSGSDKDKDLVIAYTDANGKYTLRGVPYINSDVTVVATLDTTFTVIGASQQIVVTNQTVGVNFNLKSHKDMYINNLYGFPLTVENLTVDGPNVKVTGLVQWGAGISDFEAIDSHQQVRVENVTFKAETAADGRKVGVAIDASVPLKGITGMKLKYLGGQYNVLLKPASTAMTATYLNFAPQELTIKRVDGKGSISGKMQIVDNSFNYTASYLNFSDSINSFYLATKGSDGTLSNTIQTIVSPLTESATNAINTSLIAQNASIGSLANIQFVSPGIAANLSSLYANLIAAGYVFNKPLYYLTNATGGPISFKLLGFGAKANPQNSYLDDAGRIHLDVDLKCYVPNAKPDSLTVNIPNLVLDNNAITPTKGKNLQVGLGGSGGWVLEAEDWTLSTAEGGITSNNVYVRTNVIDIPLAKFTLRPDMFLMIPDTLNGNFRGLTMGGGAAPVTLLSGGKAVLQWNSAIGNDLTGHWAFTITGQGGTAAASVQLADLFTTAGAQGKLDILFLQILDNNLTTFQLKPPSTPLLIQNNPLAKFSPQTIYNGPDFIDVIGSLDIGAPRVGNMKLTLNYNKSQQMTPTNVVLDFIAKGFVHFQADTLAKNISNISINKDSIQIFGQVFENPKTFNNMPAVLVARAKKTPTYSIDISKNWITQLTTSTGPVRVGDTPATSQEGFSVNIAKGGTVVSGNDWGVFTFEGIMTDNNPDDKDGLQPTYMKFTVYGDIIANADAVGITNMTTPFGKLSVVFDVPKKRLIGHLHVTTDIDIPIIPPIELTVNELQVQFLADPKGFCLSAAATGHVKPVPSLLQKTNFGFMLGYYRDTETLRKEIWPLVNTYIVNIPNECYLDHICSQGGLSGTYATLEQVIFDFSMGINAIIASVDVTVKSFARADFFMQFVGGSGLTFNTGVSLLYKTHVEAGASVGAGLASVRGSVRDLLMAYAILDARQELTVEGCLERNFEITTKALWGLFEDTHNVLFKICAGTEGLGIKIELGKGSRDDDQSCKL